MSPCPGQESNLTYTIGLNNFVSRPDNPEVNQLPNSALGTIPVRTSHLFLAIRWPLNRRRLLNNRDVPHGIEQIHTRLRG